MEVAPAIRNWVICNGVRSLGTPFMDIVAPQSFQHFQQQNSKYNSIFVSGGTTHNEKVLQSVVTLNFRSKDAAFVLPLSMMLAYPQ